MKQNNMNNVKSKDDSKKNSEVFESCSFSSFGLHPTLCNQLKERLGFECPTKVQAEAIPIVLSGRHLLVNAATGTRKTVACRAPIIHHLQNINPRIQRADGTFDAPGGGLVMKMDINNAHGSLYDQTPDIRYWTGFPHRWNNILSHEPCIFICYSYIRLCTCQNSLNGYLI